MTTTPAATAHTGSARAIEQVALRGTIAVGPLVAVTASGLDVGPPPLWLAALVLVLSTGHAWLPESGLGTAAMLLVLGWWGLGPVSAAAPPVSMLVATAGLLVTHVAALLVSYGPPQLPVDPTLGWTWLRRSATALLVGWSAWLLAVAVEGQPEPAGVWVAGLVAAALAAVVAGAAFVVPEGREGPGDPEGPENPAS